jgi:hypothetical protein
MYVVAGQQNGWRATAAGCSASHSSSMARVKQYGVLLGCRHATGAHGLINPAGLDGE